MAKFKVDTHLFRELGELLVGRDSTALVELIKNAYDADATKVIVHGEHLDDPKQGKITIQDNGVGMTPDDFESGFLRIASRFKELGDRLSPIYQRRYTGAKGIGRLSAHKLAKFLHIFSIPSKEILKKDKEAPIDRVAIDASIDWDKIESYQTLDDIEDSDAIASTTDPVSTKSPQGTIIELKRLRKKWTTTERARFFAEVHTFSPPEVLIKLPALSATDNLLFHTPTVRTSASTDPGISISLTGEFEAGEDYWESLAQTAQWIIEVNARRSDGKVKFNILPTKKGLKEFPEAEQKTFKMDHPNSELGPFFHARILIREGGAGSREEKAWLGRASGIRVYMEGFRVLPFGEPNDDWLSIDSDYTKRQKALPFSLDPEFAGKPADQEEGLMVLRKSSYFGAVFLTLPKSKSLRMLVNREGFVPEEGYDSLVHIMRTAIYLSVRVRAAAKSSQREERSEKRRSSTDISQSRLDLQQEVESKVNRASELAREARKLAAAGDYDRAKDRIEQAATTFSEGGGTAQRLMTEGTILRILASVGMQMSAFVHEINSLLGSITAVEDAVARLQENEDLPSSARKQIAKLHLALGDLRRSVERHASYLSDVVTPDARRRRSRHKLAERFDAAIRIVEPQAIRRDIQIINDIPPELKSPPMFQAELVTIFSNLLTNAVKAARKEGKVRANGKEDDERIVIRIENTGVEVDLSEGEKWFKPFETTTTQVDPILGQGMGMGLPITRNMLEQYGADINFVTPRSGYATAIEITFPK